MTYRKPIRRAAALACLLLAPLTGAEAQEISPVRSVISAAKGEVASITVRNNEGQPMPIQVSVVRREGSGESETTRPADGDFVIFPPQAMIQPDASQVFRVQYRGPQVSGDPARYFAIFTRIPLAIAQGQSVDGLAVNIAYRIGVDVAP